MLRLSLLQTQSKHDSRSNALSILFRDASVVRERTKAHDVEVMGFFDYVFNK